VEYRPDYGDAHYDLACFLSLAGEIDNSLKELEIALKLSPNLGSLARKDSDLNNVRSNPRYEKILPGLPGEKAK
jgi:Tfp pilus assembly protein PilF